MSTVADLVPYLQAAIDARVALAPARTAHNNAESAMNAARRALVQAVAGGSVPASSVQTEMQAYVNARATYFATNTTLATRVAQSQATQATFDTMAELLAKNEPIPPFGGP
jgi:hypothetical protein